MECENKRLADSFFRKLAADNGIYPKHRNDGGRRRKKLKERKRNRLYLIFSYAVFFRRNTSIRGNAAGYAKDSEGFPSDAGHRAYEVGFSWLADR